MEESNGPRVFEEGAITQVIGIDGSNLYAGTLRIKHVEKIEVAFDFKTGTPTVKIKFESKNEKNSREIEENARIIKALPWIETS